MCTALSRAHGCLAPPSVDLRSHNLASRKLALALIVSYSDVNKDWSHKDKDKDKDQTLKDQDKDQTYKDKDKDLTYNELQGLTDNLYT